ncbi:MAG: phage holin family protein [Erythrobacter sp.]|nr:phage holin family protein [Erythrobacter sp.]MDZ4140360.1 phage holin family protein [Erythrobacter sp.]MDZ4271303.1 phage holin family protein [Erythrobacter sp.]MDZ4275002.1 phage holin family protein [Erythrobacter sp.]
MDNPEPGPLPSPPDDSADPAASPDGDPGEDSNSFDSLRDDITALVDDARTYAEAEIAFQKTRAGLASRKTARALALLVLALVLLHIALIALAVGAVIALAPLVTIWGAIAIVVGVLLAGVATLVWAALGNGKAVAAMFGLEDGA